MGSNHRPATILTGDFAAPGAAEAMVAGRPDVVFHLASIVSGEGASRDVPVSIIAANPAVALGMADDLLSTLCLARPAAGDDHVCPLLLAPVMVALYWLAAVTDTRTARLYGYPTVAVLVGTAVIGHHPRRVAAPPPRRRPVARRSPSPLPSLQTPRPRRTTDHARTPTP